MENIMDALERAKRGDTDYFAKVKLDVIEKARSMLIGNSVFIEAVTYGHLSCCKEIYRRCPQLLYQTNKAKNTALHHAAYNGSDDIVKFLLSASAKLEQEEESIENGGGGEELVTCKLLMMVSSGKRTALHSAAGKGHLQSAKLLIDADPSKKLVRMVDQDSETAMHHAVRNHHLEIVELLLGVDPDFVYLPNNNGMTPLKMACEEAMFCYQKTAEIRKVLIEKQPAQYRRPTNQNKWSLIHYATRRGQLATVKEIISFWPGCCEWVEEEHGQNFLHVAARCGQVSVVTYALQQKDITNNVWNAKDIHGNTPLHLAISSGDASLAFAFLNNPRVNKLLQNMDGKNPLDVASETLLTRLSKVVFHFAGKGDVDFFSAIEVRVFENSRDENGESVLSAAVARGHLDCCKVILGRCEKLLFQTNNNGTNSFHTAVSNKQDDILEFLLKYGQEVRVSGRRVIQRPSYEFNEWGPKIQMALENASSDQKHTALHLAVQGGHLKSAKLLIGARLLIGAMDREHMLTMKNLHKETAMHMAVKGHHLEIVKLLVEALPEFTYCTDDAGYTPHLIALQEAFSGDPRTVEIRNFLIEKQPNQCGTPTGTNKWSLIHHATYKGDLRAIKKIIRFYPDWGDSTDTECNNILHLAAKFNHVDIVKYIMSMGNVTKDLVNGKDMYGNTPSHIAKSCGNQEIADSLRNDDRFNNFPNMKGEKASDMGPSVPFQCAEKGDADFFRTIQVDFLEKSVNEDGDSLLSVSVREGHLTCYQVISKRCPELLYQTNKSGLSPLHMAAFHGKIEIVKLLLEADFRKKKLLSMTDNHNETALHYAVKKHHLKIVKLIVKADSKFEYSANDSGETPLFIALNEAIDSNDQTTVKIRRHLIKEQSSQICKIRIGMKKRTLLQYAISKHDLNAVREIMRSCRDCLPLVDVDGQNVLHHAVSNGSVELVNYILDMQDIKDISDSFLNWQDKNGDTPLHLATAGESVNISLSLLYDSRVQKMILNNEQKSALDKIDFAYDLSRAKVEGLPDLVDIKELKSRSEYDLLVGALISTVSFTVGITVPGGFFSEGPNRGNAILHKKRTFHAFVVFNTTALVLSLFVVFSHFCLRRLVSKKSIVLQLRMATFSLIGSIFAMLLAFIMGSFAVFSISLGLSITVCVICCCFFGASAYCYWMTIGQKKSRRRARNQQSFRPLLDRQK